MSAGVAPAPDWGALFRVKIGANVRGWHAYVAAHERDNAALAAEFSNMETAVERGLAEPSARADAIALVVDLFEYVDESGRWLAWREKLERALAAARDHGDRRAEVALLDQLGSLALALGDPRGGLARQEEALARARPAEDGLAAARILYHIGRQHYVLNDFEAADRCAAAAEERFRALGERRYRGHALLLRGLVSERTGRLDEAVGHIRSAEALYAEIGDGRNLAYAINSLGGIYRAERNYPAAMDCYARAAALHRAQGLEAEAARARMNWAITLHQQGDTERALLVQREVEAVFERLGDRPWLAFTLNNEGVFLAALGRREEALQAYVRAGDLHRATGNVGSLAGTLLNRAELLLDTGCPDEALALVAEADGILAALPTPPAWVARFRKTLGERVAGRGGADHELVGT